LEVFFLLVLKVTMVHAETLPLEGERALTAAPMMNRGPSSMTSDLGIATSHDPEIATPRPF